MPRDGFIFLSTADLDFLQFFLFGDRNINDFKKRILKEVLCLYQFCSKAISCCNLNILSCVSF